jgi:hypothetical protein
MMVRKVQSVSGGVGYRHQLDRARRFLERVEMTTEDWADMDDVEFQDMMWAFFQNCWHVKDWLKNDPLVSQVVKDAAIQLAHKSQYLKMCQELCNGTKHLDARPGASHHHVNTTIIPGAGIRDLDCIVDDGSGKLISGKQLATDCVAEWERILGWQGLAIARQS